MDSLILIKSLAIVAAVLALLYGCLLLAKRRGLQQGGAHKRLLILECQRLDHKSSLLLVKADTQEYLVALGPTSAVIYLHSPRT